VIFDLGLNLNPLSMVALDRSDQIELVLQPTMPNVRAGRRLQEILMSLGCPLDRLRLVLNRNTRSSDRARAALEEVLGMRAACVIPEDSDVVLESVNQGHPVSRLARNSAVARALQSCAKQLVDGDSRTAHGAHRSEPLIARLFGRGATPKLKSM